MQFPGCAASLDDGSWECPRCGYLFERAGARLQFLGRPFEVLYALLLMIFSTVLIVPSAWAFAAVCRWFCSNLRFSDGTVASFEGRGGQIVGWWILSLFTGGYRLLPVGVHVNLISCCSIHGPVQYWVDALGYLVACYCTLQIIRWFVRNVRLSSGSRFSFVGKYPALTGWAVLNSLLILTVIGWAWSLAASYRWLARNTKADKATLRFNGEGSELLMRVIVAVVCCIPIVTIPWAWLWYTRWLVSEVTVEFTPGA